MKAALLVLALGLSAYGQVVVNTTASHIRWGPNLPTRCSPNTGDIFFKTTSTIGPYWCSATNSWTFNGSAGSGTPGGSTNSLQINNGSGGFAGLASLGTTTTVLIGNVAGPPSFGAVNLGTMVTGSLAAASVAGGNPVFNTVVGQPSTDASSLVGRYNSVGQTSPVIEVQTNLNAHVCGINANGSTDCSISALTQFPSIATGTVLANTTGGSAPASATTLSSIFAAPPAIGGTTPAAGAFTTLSATGAVTLSGLSLGTQVSCLGLSSLNAVVLSNAGCGTGGGSGTVTSIGLVGTANQITVTGASPITSSGSWTLSIPNNPTLPGTTTGTFSGNLTGNVTGNASGTAATITGALALANTPLTTTQDILYDNAGALGRLPIVTSGQCLGNSGGVWTSLVCSGGSGITSLNTLTASSLTIAAGTGIGSIVLSGGNTITIPVDTTIIASIDQVHANLNFPTRTSTGVTALTFTSNTKPIAAYSAGMCFVMNTDTANPVSANIDALGIKALDEPDGSTPWPSGLIAAGQYFEGCYDGTVLRVVWPPASGMVYPGAGIAVSTGSAWTTSLTAPTGSLVGTGQANTYTTGLQSLASADFLSPVHSADPGTCTAGQFEFNSTTPAFKGCTATNTWTAFAAGSTPSFPLTVAGTVTSGGIPYFNTTTQESSSALLALNHILLGGGAGGAPTSDAKLDDGATTPNTLNYTGTGGFVASGGPVVAGSAIPSLAAGTGAFFGGVEGTAPTAGFPAAGYDGCSASSASHGLLCSFNNDTASLMARYSNNLSVFAATTSAQLAGVLSDETGTGLAVFGTSPAFTTDIHSTTAGTATVGTAALPFGSVYVGGAATNNIKITGTSAAARVETVPDVAADKTFALETTSTTANQIKVSTTTAGLSAYKDLPQVFEWPAANCVSTVPGSAWNTTLTPTCFAGTNNLGGYLPFVDTSAGQFAFQIPGDWDTTQQPYIKIVFGSLANTTGTVIFNVATACSKEDGSVTSDPTFTTADALTTKTMAAATRMWSTTVQMTQVTSGNNCLPGGLMLVKVTRGTDTASTAVSVEKAVITVPRLPVVQAN